MIKLIVGKRIKLREIISEETKLFDRHQFRDSFDLFEQEFMYDYIVIRGNTEVLVGRNWIVVLQKKVPTYVFHVYEIQVATFVRETVFCVAGHGTNHRLDLISGDYEVYRNR